LSKYSKYNLNHLNILIAVLWLCCANIVVVGIKMSDFSLENDDSLSSLSDSSGDDLEELLEDRVRPKNENYFEETIPQYNEQEFMEHFRVSRQVANSIAERFEMSDYFKPQSGCYGKLSPLQQTQIFLWFAGHQTASFRDVADRFNITISSLYRIIRRFIYFLSNCSPQVIKWPTQIEKNQIEEHFRQNGFPGVIGTIDGSHIKIDKPSDDPESYMNRKGYYSIQVSTTVSTCLFSVSVLIWSLPTLFVFLWFSDQKSM
jgi:hypothetical protein